MICRRRSALASLSAATALLAAGCGSTTGASSSGNTQGTANKTITIGVLADLTGAAASGTKTVVNGVKAGTFYASRNGYNLKYVLADTATNPTTAMAAAQKLVTQNHVTAVVGESALLFTVTNYLTAHNVPVIGDSSDGPEWVTSKNMFGVVGELQQTKVSTTFGKLLKQLGVTNLASLGYGASPVSSESASSSALSAQVAGVKSGYLDAKFPLGSTDVGPVVLAIKAAGADGLYPAVAPATGFALANGLHDQGVNLKALFLPAGYGGDLLASGASAVKDAQDAYFTLGFEPVEMQTAATKQLQADYASAKITTAPTYAGYIGYTAVGLLVRAFKAAGPTPTSASVIKALQGIHDWDAMGLFGGHKVDINDRTNIVAGPDNCTWVTQFKDGKFVLVKGAAPVCGTLVPGQQVSPAT